MAKSKILQLCIPAAQDHLGDGEHVRFAIPCQSGLFPGLAFGPLEHLTSARLIVATSSELLILNQMRYRVMVKELAFRGPLDAIEPNPRLSGLLYAQLRIDGERLWIHRRFFDDVRRLVAEISH